MTRTFATTLLAGLIAALLPAADAIGPRRVLIVRHGEKPAVGAESIHLSAAGSDRANALRQLFEATANRPEPFTRPDFLFAAKDSGNSHRPSETIAPLAKKFKLTVDASFHSDEPAKLASHLLGNAKYAGKTILVAWRHGKIPELATALKASDVPKRWPDEVFDRVWQIDYESGKATLRDRPQRLMPGDAER